MNLDWQNLTVLLLVGLAVGFLAWTARRSMALRKGAVCGGCSSCSENSTQDQAGDGRRQIVALDTLARSAELVAHPNSRDQGG